MNRIQTTINKKRIQYAGFTEFLCIRTAPVLCICKLFFQFIIYLPTSMYISVFYQKSINTPELPLLSLAYNILSFPFRLSPGSSGLRFGISGINIKQFKRCYDSVCIKMSILITHYFLGAIVRCINRKKWV